MECRGIGADDQVLNLVISKRREQISEIGLNFAASSEFLLLRVDPRVSSRAKVKVEPRLIFALLNDPDLPDHARSIPYRAIP
jgi:hypothetical protein